LFRQADLPALRQRAKTPEGQAIIKRLRVLLNGSDGETMPEKFGVKGPVGKDGAGEFANAPAGMYTLSHAAGFGLLYQLTGEKKYAELGRQAMEKAFEGYRDRDQRYAFKAPFGALRAGPSLGWTALGYDLCYDGWPEDYRRKVAAAIANYNEGQWMSLAELARGARQHPGSNHWGMEVGGAALALLAVMNDPGVEMARLNPLLEQSQKAMIRNMTEGFGDGGFFAEGDGTGSMSSHIVFLSALQAWRTAAGKDFISPRPNAQWMALKWFYLTVPSGDRRNLRKDFPERGAYPHNIWARADKSGGGYFSIGFGVVSDAQKAAMLWFYNHSGLRELDAQNSTPFDTPSPYPHHAVLSFVNWPFGLPEKNPGEVFPRVVQDSRYTFYMFRNRWQDENDIVVTVLLRGAKGNYSVPGGSILVRGLGRNSTFPVKVTGSPTVFQPGKRGGVVSTSVGSFGVDFSGASGADALLVLSGPIQGTVPAKNVQTVQAGGTTFTIMTVQKGAPPVAKAQDDKVVIGRQTVSFDGRKIVFAE
jgi:hypothetical protein